MLDLYIEKRIANQKKIFDAAQAAKITVRDFAYIPFQGVDFKSFKLAPATIYGSVNAVVDLENSKIKTWQNNRLNMNYLLEKVQSNMLSFDGRIITDLNELDFSIVKEYFIKPNSWKKEFAGGVVNVFHFDEFKKSVRADEYFVASVQKIRTETRSWIMNGKLIDAVTYDVDGVIQKSRVEPSKQVLNLISKFRNNFNPCQKYVLDIAETDNGAKILELGCVNCSGFYTADIEKILVNICK